MSKLRLLAVGLFESALGGCSALALRGERLIPSPQLVFHRCLFDPESSCRPFGKRLGFLRVCGLPLKLLERSSDSLVYLSHALIVRRCALEAFLKSSVDECEYGRLCCQVL